MARYFAIAAILDFARYRQTHKLKFRGLLVCFSGGVQDAVSKISSLPFFPMKSPNFTGLLTLQAPATINRLYFVLQAEQITVIGNEMSVQTSRFSNIWSKIKQL